MAFDWMPAVHRLAMAAAIAAAVQVTAAHAERLASSEISVIDGDTIQIGSGERIRLLDIDTPETHTPRCPAELIRGKQASQQLGMLLRSAGEIQLARSGQLDKYGRTLGRVSVDGHDVGHALIEAGLAVEWQPGRAAWLDRQRHWCGGGGQ